MNRATSPTGWVRNPDGTLGWTWNPITGCLNHVNGLCKGGNFPCYAYKLANGRLKQRYLANENVAGGRTLTDLDLFRRNDPFYPRLWEERLEEIKRGYHYTDWSGACEFGAKAKGIFVCDMSDLFGIGIPEEWTKRVLKAISEDKIDRFYLLTKQAQNLPQWSPFPDNCYVGVTATNGTMFHQATEYLADIKATVKFVSAEPLLEQIDLAWAKIAGLDWLIIGACTGTYQEMERLSERLYAQDEKLKIDRLLITPFGKGKYTLQPKIEWVQEIVEAADKAGVKVFLKDNLKPLIYSQPAEWAFKAGEYRQEVPK